MRLLLGVILALGPLWGVPFTLVSMIDGFRAANAGQPINTDAMSPGLTMGFNATYAGLFACPIGIAIIIWVIASHRAQRKKMSQQLDH